MTAPAELAKNTEQLLHVLKKGEAIVIAGTGVSASVSTNPLIRSWSALLRHAVEFCCARCHDANEISETCRRFDATQNSTLDELLAIGDEVQDYLNRQNLMEKWLETVFAGISPNDDQLIRAIEKLRIPVATTNYDHLFEDITRRTCISWRDTAKLQRFLNGSERAILHLHGHFRDAQSIILGKKSYEQLLEEEFAQFAEQALFSRYNVVFIGFGDSTKDPNFSRLLTWSRRYLSATRIFRVVRESELDTLADEHKTLGYNIQLVSYGANYSDLPAFLEGLACQLPEEPTIPANLREGCPDNIGRGPLIETVVDQMILAPPAGKPIALLGTGGIGKTNTVLNALFHRRTAIHFGEHRYFVRCDGVTTPDLLWAKTLESLGLQPTPHQKPQQQVETFLAKITAVLVFDNAETPFAHFQAEMDALLLRLKTLPALKLVVTYRGRAMPGVKMGWHGIPIPALTDEQAQSLFLNIMGDQFADDPALPDLLREVDYLPLAITLLAERAKDYNTIGDLFRKWQQKRTDLLNIAPDQKDLNLEVSVLLSFDSPRLTDDSRELFKALCWLPGGLPRQLWEDAFPDHDDDQNALLRAALIDEDTTGRLRVLAPVREVISRKFGVGEFWLEQTVKHLLTTVAEYGRNVGYKEGYHLLIQAEWNNLVKLFSDYSYTEWLINGLTDLTLYCQFTGQDLRPYLEKADQLAQDNGWLVLQARCLCSLGDVSLFQSEKGQAQVYYSEALSICEHVGDSLGKANCIAGLGDVAFRQSYNEQAKKYYQEALPIYEQEGDSVGKARCLSILGDVYFYQSDLEQAERYYKESFLLYEQVGNILDKSNTLKRLGDIAFTQSDMERAEIYYKEVLPFYEQVGNLLGKANCLKSLGDVYSEKFDMGRAGVHCWEALSIYEQLDNLIGQANCLRSLGDMSFRQLDNEKGNKLYEEAISMYQKTGNLYSIGRAYYYWSNWQADDNKRRDMRCLAKKAWEEAKMYNYIEQTGLTDAC